MPRSAVFWNALWIMILTVAKAQTHKQTNSFIVAEYVSPDCPVCVSYTCCSSRSEMAANFDPLIENGVGGSVGFGEVAS